MNTEFFNEESDQWENAPKALTDVFEAVGFSLRAFGNRTGNCFNLRCYDSIFHLSFSGCIGNTSNGFFCSSEYRFRSFESTSFKPARAFKMLDECKDKIEGSKAASKAYTEYVRKTGCVD